MDPQELEQRIGRGDTAERRFKKMQKDTVTTSELDKILLDLSDAFKALESTSGWLFDPEIGIAKLQRLERQAEAATGTKRAAWEELTSQQKSVNEMAQALRDREVDSVKVPGLNSIAYRMSSALCRDTASAPLTVAEKHEWTVKLIKLWKSTRSIQQRAIEVQGAASGAWDDGAWAV